MQVTHGSRAAPNWNASIPAWLMPYAQKNSRSQILLVSCLLLYPFHRKPPAGNSPYTTKGYGQNTVHSLLHTNLYGKKTIYEKDIKSLSCTAAFPDEILTCYITLYSVQCFIGFDCTELIFFLGGSSFVM